MQIDIHDDPDNWAKWGTLVKLWVTDPKQRPATTDAMDAQMKGAGVVGSIPGSNRPVQFYQYNDIDGPLVFPLPTATMINNDDAGLVSIAAKPPGQRQYPLQSFYAVAFGGQPRVDLGINELRALALRRLGEYTILECQ